MHKNRNRKAVLRVEKGMMKANRTRNMFAVLAVILTTFLITTVFSLGINYMENMKLSAYRILGTSADVSLSFPTPEQESKIRALDYVTRAGRQYEVGAVEGKNQEGRNLQIAIRNYDKTEWERHYKKAISDCEGAYPQKENEVMLSEGALRQLGISSPKRDMEISLTYHDKKGSRSKSFVLSGWFRSYAESAVAFVSDLYCQNAGCTMEEDGLLSLSLKKPTEDVLKLQKDVPIEENQELLAAPGSIKSTGVATIAVVEILVLFIIGSGCLLIYNILYISISKDTCFFGLLKTIGTSPTQIQMLVKRQAAKFALVGIPIGIALATAVSCVLVPFVLQEGFETGKSSMDAEMFFHPSIFLCSILFSAVTVWLSCNAPARAAAKVSPVEALRYRNFAPQKAKSRKSTNGGKLCAMAFHNVFRDKKRAVLVFLSLFMGTVTILGVNGLVGSVSGENYISTYMDYHFQYIDTQFADYERTEKETPQLDEPFVKQISGMDGVRNVTVNKATWAKIGYERDTFRQALKALYEISSFKAENRPFEDWVSAFEDYAGKGWYGGYVSTIDKKYIEEYNKTHGAGIDTAAFERGETAILGFDDQQFAPNRELVGKTVSLTSDNTDGKTASFGISGVFQHKDYPENVISGHRRTFDVPFTECVFVSEAGMQRLTFAPIICNIGINIENPDEMEAMEYKLIKQNTSLTGDRYEFISSAAKLAEWNAMFYSLALLGNGAAAILIVIGLMNFVNVMLTGVLARKNEFAIMESIGTTKRQIRKILTMEGGFYALISTAMILTFGNAFLALVAKAAPEIVDYAKFEYPVLLVVCLIEAIIGICLSVPALVYRAVSKKTVIEQLRDFEN